MGRELRSQVGSVRVTRREPPSQPNSRLTLGRKNGKFSPENVTTAIFLLWFSLGFSRKLGFRDPYQDKSIPAWEVDHEKTAVNLFEVGGDQSKTYGSKKNPYNRPVRKNRYNRHIPLAV